jgi:hypothetical protein
MPDHALSHPDPERLEAAAFRRLLEHLRQREDASNIDLMGLAGFCRNCLADWLADASVDTGHPLTLEEARAHVYGEPYAQWKARQPEATPEQVARMEASLAENGRRRGSGERLDRELDATFPASDPLTVTKPS